MILFAVVDDSLGSPIVVIRCTHLVRVTVPQRPANSDDKDRRSFLHENLGLTLFARQIRVVVEDFFGRQHYGFFGQLWVLGGAETSRVRMAVAEAISHVTGVGLLLLDELNVSVAQDSTRVRNWLTKIGQTTQIIAAAATNAPGPPNVPENAPVRMFWVENGNITKCSPS